MVKKMKIAILGPGAWGTALGNVLAKQGNQVVLIGKKDIYQSINTLHENTIKFPGVRLSDNLSYSINEEESLKDIFYLVFAVPSKAYREEARKVNEFFKKNPPKEKITPISLAKGFDPTSHERLSSVLREEINEEYRNPIVTLVGPSFAEEVIVDRVTCLDAVSLEEKEAKKVQSLFKGSNLRLYTIQDEVGAEFFATLKNVLAIAGGILKGMDQGENAKAALITRGSHEILRLVLAYGGKEETVLALCGIGDLILTCSSEKSRNYSLGLKIGKADSAKEVLAENKETVEGVYSSKYALSLAKAKNIDVPLTEAVYKILFEGGRPSVVLSSLMDRPFKAEEDV